MSVPIHCACGAVRGELDPGAVYAPVVCYCRDCRAHPFFKDGHPLAEPRVLTREERTAASRD